MFKENEYSILCDWFEGTCWPQMPIDDFVHHFMNSVFTDLSQQEISDMIEWSVRGWQGYNYRCIVGANENLVQFFFRSTHCIHGDLFDKVNNIPLTHHVSFNEETGEVIVPYFDVHIIVSGSGLRYMGNERALRMMKFFAVKGYAPSANECPRFAYDFVPSRIDMAMDFYTIEFPAFLSDAFVHEYNYNPVGAALYSTGNNRVSSNMQRKTLKLWLENGSTNVSWGSRGASSCYFRLYDKNLEQLNKVGQSAHPIWWRMEYETRQIVALNVALQLIYRQSVVGAFSFCAERQFKVVEDRYDDRHRANNPDAVDWQLFLDFLGSVDIKYHAAIVIEPYTFSHLVQLRKNLTMQDTILMYVADPFCFVSKYGSDLLDKVRKHRKYKALMQRLERLTALSAEDIAAIYSYDYNFGIHPVFTGDEFLF